MARYGINGHQTHGRMSSYWKLHGINEDTHHDQMAKEAADDNIRDVTNPDYDREYKDAWFSEDKWSRWRDVTDCWEESLESRDWLTWEIKDAA